MNRMRILVVDDDEDFAESLGEILANKGHEVSVVYNPLQALALVNKIAFDRVFLDVKMPDMNGVELFRKMKAVRPDIKVVLITGFSFQEWLDEANASGVFGVMDKPLDINKLLTDLDCDVDSGFILIADDDVDCVESIKEVLTEWGGRVQTAYSGQEVVDLVSTMDFKVLILDMKMPGLDGLDVLQILQSSAKQIPVVVVTGYRMEYERHLEKFAINALMEKPLDMLKLNDILKGIV